MEKIRLADQTEMQIYIARGVSDQKLPGLLLIQEAFGVNDNIKSIADRLATEGYVVYAPEIYHRTAGDNFLCGYDEFKTKAMPHYEAVTPNTLDIDLKGTFEAIKKDPAVDSNKIGVIGFCLGGKVSFYANSILPLKASICFYGGGISSEEMLDRASKLSGPTLFLWGGKDANIKENDRKRITDTLTREKKPYMNIVFSEADHGFFCDARPAYHPESAKLAWDMVKSFLKEHLK